MTCKCVNCNEIYNVVDCTKIETKKSNYKYVCGTCKTDLNPNFLKNELVNGKVKSNGFDFTLTFGTSASTKDNAFLYEHGYDCKFSELGDTTWISPRYEGLSAIPKMLKSFETELIKGIDYNKNCYSVIKINNISFYQKDYKTLHKNREIFNSLILAMLDIKNNTDFFGTDVNTIFYDFSNIINVKKDGIELKCLYQNKTQFMQLIKFMRAITTTLFNNFIQYADEFETVFTIADTDRGSSGFTGTLYKRKYQVTSDKLLKILLDYTR